MTPIAWPGGFLWRTVMPPAPSPGFNSEAVRSTSGRDLANSRVTTRYQLRPPRCDRLKTGRPNSEVGGARIEHRRHQEPLVSLWHRVPPQSVCWLHRPVSGGRRICGRLAMLAAACHGAEDDLGPDTENHQIDDHLCGDEERAPSDLAVISPNPTVAKVVTVKYSASVWVSFCPKLPAEIAAITT